MIYRLFANVMVACNFVVVLACWILIEYYTPLAVATCYALIFAAIFWVMWVVFIEHALSPRVVYILGGILGCALMAGGVVAVEWIVTSIARFPEKTRASRRLNSLIRRSGGEGPLRGDEP